MSSRRFVAPTLVATVLFLTSCSAAEFAREQTAEDRPDSVVDGSAGEVDVATLRHVGKADEYDVYFARGSDDSGKLCLSLVLDEVWQSTDCERDYVSVEISDSASVAAEINHRGGEGREMLSENVWISRK
ncbi:MULTISPECIES: hypothetical protein [unclassified Microbacterium]|uniref:hypothetical protein n=1 Tax=unclassified Microbacterium TaxID=2609290 RepID=UPI00214CFD97|nr:MULTISPECIES: hypothetical protein [unclassified Microbacterium]MCR2784593.1 hypothetical protein [Microbacterium sp. zg.B96]MDL5350488.1 hypothetical protein [Microbacterium sp. zg-YB36]WIM14600.1 hypothetical protein QNO11_08425 [Microbacterium sp. zg-B96]